MRLSAAEGFAGIPVARLALVRGRERFVHQNWLRLNPGPRILKTMLYDRDVRVRRLREGYEFFKSLRQRKDDLEASKTAAAASATPAVA